MKKQLLSTHSKTTLAVTADDLRKWHKEVINDTKREMEKAAIADKSNNLIDAKQVSTMLSVDMTTLWRWEKKGYLQAFKIGGKRKYKLSDVESLIKGDQK